MNQKRLFTALRFPKKTIDQLANLVDSLKELDPKARYVSPIENYHLTLYFIGMTENLETVETAFKEACTKYVNLIGKPITLEFTKLGTFRSRGGSILWLGIKNNPDVEKLADFIRESIKETGLPVDPKKFRAHITIARKYDGEIPETIKCPDPITVDKAALVWSHRNQENILTYDNLLFMNLTK